MAGVAPAPPSSPEAVLLEAHPAQMEAIDFMGESKGDSSATGASREGKARAVKAISSRKRKLAMPMPSSDITKLNFGDDNSIESSIEGSTTKISTSRRNRSTKIHNTMDQQQDERINERMKVLHDLIPNSSKVDEISMLDDVIEYFKMLQCQLQMMCSLKNRIPSPILMAFPVRDAHCPPPQLNICIGLPCYNPLGMVYGSILSPILSYLPTTSYARQNTQEHEWIEGLQTQASSNTPIKPSDHK